MALPAESKLGSYQILTLLGAGGMGEVYRARDTELGREVAIKVLPEAFTEDQERLARFEREARLLASLNHPNIATLYGLERSEGIPFLVMELVEGETLEAKVAKGSIPIEEALPLFRQIAEALEAAHEKGVIHRDLKPANIKVTQDGKVKILDFGLAKAFDEPALASNFSESPTATRGTAAGVILGTAPYKSPEQARGKSVDRRTDIWAFGCCFYEALTARRLFDGDTIADVLGAIVKTEPRWESLPDGTPSKIRELLRRCLQKDARRRLRDMGEAWVAIEEASSEPSLPAVSVSRKARAPLVIAWTLAGLSVLTAVALWFRAPPPEPTPPIRRFTIERRASFSTNLALSPDGTRLAYTDESNDGRRIFLRELDQLISRPIPGTEQSGNRMFFSPDGEWIGFGEDQWLKKVSVNGGSPITLSDADGIYGGSWGQEGYIVFGSYEGGLWRVPEEGGVPEELRPIDTEKGEVDIHLAEILPGGQAIIYTLHRGGGLFRIEVLSLKTRSWHVLIDGGFSAQYSPTGHIVYGQSNLLYAAPFDLERLELTGPSVRVLENLDTRPADGNARFALGRDGTLVFVPEATRQGRRLVWVAGDGSEEPLEIEPRAFRHPRLSADGTELAVAVRDGERHDIWIYDLANHTHRRFTYEGDNLSPVWTSDGSRIAYSSDRGGALELFWQPADGSGAPERLLTSDNDLWAGEWVERQKLLYAESPPTDTPRIGLIDVVSKQDQRAIIETRFRSASPRFSPDHRWLAFMMEAGELEVFVAPFPSLQGRRQISTDGGYDPIWAPDGRTLYYRRGDSDRMMAVPIRTEGALETGRARQILERRYAWSDPVFSPIPNWDVAPDGRFLMIRPSEEELTAPPIHVVLNWAEELKRRVPVNR